MLINFCSSSDQLIVTLGVFANKVGLFLRPDINNAVYDNFVSQLQKKLATLTPPIDTLTKETTVLHNYLPYLDNLKSLYLAATEEIQFDSLKNILHAIKDYQNNLPFRLEGQRSAHNALLPSFSFLYDLFNPFNLINSFNRFFNKTFEKPDFLDERPFIDNKNIKLALRYFQGDSTLCILNIFKKNELQPEHLSFLERDFSVFEKLICPQVKEWVNKRAETQLQGNNLFHFFQPAAKILWDVFPFKALWNENDLLSLFCLAWIIPAFTGIALAYINVLLDDRPVPLLPAVFHT